MRVGRMLVVSFANQPRYRKLAARLYQMCRAINLPISILTETSLRQLTPYPGHASEPYSFKIHAIESIAAESSVVLWLDTSILLLPSGLRRIRDKVQKDGYMIHGGRWPLTEWVSDDCLSLFNVDRRELGSLAICYSGFVAFDLSHAVGQRIFSCWKKSQEQGGFSGPRHIENRAWKGHRHDQSCLSLVLRELELPTHQILDIREEAGVLRPCDLVIDRRGRHSSPDVIRRCQGIGHARTVSR